MRQLACRSRIALVVVVVCSVASCSSSSTSSPASTAASTSSTVAGTSVPTTAAPAPSEAPTTAAPTTDAPTTDAPTTVAPTTIAPTTVAPTTTIVAAADVPAAASAACASGSAAAPGESTLPFTSVGLDGTYILHVPPMATGSDPLPLVIELHGYSEPAAVQEVQSGLTTYGDTMGFVTVLPQITRPVPRWDSNVGSPDVHYLSDLLDHLEATVCVDTNRIGVAGLSNGAFMTSILACDLSGRIAAAAPVAGIQAPDDCKPDRPVPVIAFHGTADTFVPYTGGLGSSVASLPNADGTGTLGSGPPSSDPVSNGPSVPERAATWAARNGCAPDPTESAVADDVTLVQFACPPGDEVQLYRVEGGGHAWPGSAFGAQIASVVGKTTLSIDATKLIWDFFVAHPLRPAAG
ncbi:MAG: poly(3-hydroxybutyrate) depolymerase [Ilumatobacteraceae bacterium]|nr:poly(3-hydroxybutyrate) depolymerase [Ilumatobacteraceae bacterium]